MVQRPRQRKRGAYGLGRTLLSMLGKKTPQRILAVGMIVCV